jgi:Ca2+/Na+ antiporter
MPHFFTHADPIGFMRDLIAYIMVLVLIVVVAYDGKVSCLMNWFLVLHVYTVQYGTQKDINPT